MELLRHTSCVLSVHRSSSKEEALFDETVGHIQDILLGGWVGGWVVGRGHSILSCALQLLQWMCLRDYYVGR